MALLSSHELFKSSVRCFDLIVTYLFAFWNKIRKPVKGRAEKQHFYWVRTERIRASGEHIYCAIFPFASCMSTRKLKRPLLTIMCWAYVAFFQKERRQNFRVTTTVNVLGQHKMMQIKIKNSPVRMLNKSHLQQMVLNLFELRAFPSASVRQCDLTIMLIVFVDGWCE